MIESIFEPERSVLELYLQVCVKFMYSCHVTSSPYHINEHSHSLEQLVNIAITSHPVSVPTLVLRIQDHN